VDHADERPVEVQDSIALGGHWQMAGDFGTERGARTVHKLSSPVQASIDQIHVFGTPWLRPVDPANTAASFQSTIWSLVLGARGDRAHLEQLLRSYWAPVYSFIRRQGYTGHDASDLTQEFLTQVVLGRDVIGRADPTRGRFRAFLKQALRNFLIDQHRLGKAHKGGKPGPDASPAAHPAQLEDSTDPEIAGRELERSFDRVWAATVIEITLNRLEERCLADGLDAHWKAFGINVLGPAVRRTSPLPLNELARLVGAVDESQASNMLQTVKRRFRRMLREVVAETVSDGAHVEEELAELRAYFRA
jgi:RNA polymerase sigma-70 factor (ECF subfamily)